MSVKAVTLAGEKWYIGGAPRSKNAGQVLMFRPGSRGSGYLNFNPAHVLTGQQFGSGFGYDVAVADFNLDRSVRMLLVSCLDERERYFDCGSSRTR